MCNPTLSVKSDGPALILLASSTIIPK